MSGDEFARRFEVVAEIRRRWLREEKLAIVEEASGPCVNISAVARRHGIKPALLYRWRKEFGSEAPSSMSLVPVVVDFLNQTSSTKGHSTTQYCDSRL